MKPAKLLQFWNISKEQKNQTSTDAPVNAFNLPIHGHRTPTPLPLQLCAAAKQTPPAIAGRGVVLK
jgi:hypothetical protein